MEVNHQPGKPPVKPRILKIQPKIRFGKYDDAREVPEIKLCGNWLGKLGFHQGKRVSISSVDDMLIIKLEP